MSKKTQQSRPVTVIVSTYEQPAYLRLCLLALGQQTWRDFNIVVADDGSGRDTENVVRDMRTRIKLPIHHVWQRDAGFRKTRILNKAILSTHSPYLVFIDGDSLAAPWLLATHVQCSAPGFFLSGGHVRLGRGGSKRINLQDVESARVFSTFGQIRRGVWLGHRMLRNFPKARYLPWLDRHSTTQPNWLGGHASCFRSDAIRVNGFDHRFTYGFEDADFGIRLENSGLRGRHVRNQALLLHLDHDRPYASDTVRTENLARVTPRGVEERIRAIEGIDELAAGTNSQDHCLNRETYRVG